MICVDEMTGAPVGAGRWARVFATVYDPVVWAAERAGMRSLRREVVGRAYGRTLELGSGTGLNLPHYPHTVAELLLTEPAAPMRARLGRAVRRSGRKATVLDCPAERLAVEDQSIDTVVSTLVLCTVDDPGAVLDEIKRVLHPGGRMLFIEHVRSASPRLAAWQDRMEEPWRRFAEGCRCNRDTLGLFKAHRFTVEHATEASWRAMPAIVKPIVAGSANPLD